MWTRSTTFMNSISPLGSTSVTFQALTDSVLVWASCVVSSIVLRIAARWSTSIAQDGAGRELVLEVVLGGVGGGGDFVGAAAQRRAQRMATAASATRATSESCDAAW